MDTSRFESTGARSENYEGENSPMKQCVVLVIVLCALGQAQRSNRMSKHVEETQALTPAPTTIPRTAPIG